MKKYKFLGIALLAVGLCTGFCAIAVWAQQQTSPPATPDSNQPPPPPDWEQDNDGPPPRHHHRPPPPPSPLFDALDANHDGVIDSQEMANATAVLMKLDKNHTGRLTRQDLLPPPPPRCHCDEDEGGAHRPPPPPRDDN